MIQCFIFHYMCIRFPKYGSTILYWKKIQYTGILSPQNIFTNLVYKKVMVESFVFFCAEQYFQCCRYTVVRNREGWTGKGGTGDFSVMCGVQRNFISS